MSCPAPITAWHALVESRDPAGLEDLLAADATFRSPAVHTPQQGKEITTAYLRAALAVLGPTLTYHREWYAEESAVLEFSCDLDGIEVHGMDVIGWDQSGRIDDFCVLIRPHQALNAVIERMATELFG